jgi:hypothetical protein
VEDIQSKLVNPLHALTTIPRITLPNEQVVALLQGKQICLDDYSIDQACGEVAISSQAGILQSIVCRRYDNDQKWSAKRNFHAELVSD